VVHASVDPDEEPATAGGLETTAGPPASEGADGAVVCDDEAGVPAALPTARPETTEEAIVNETTSTTSENRDPRPRRMSPDRVPDALRSKLSAGRYGIRGAGPLGLTSPTERDGASPFPVALAEFGWSEGRVGATVAMGP
jgi:hypothetical protein